MILIGGVVLSMVLSKIYALGIGGQIIVGITCGIGVLDIERKLKQMREGKTPE